MSENEKGFNFSTFLDDSKNALLNPKSYFASMPVTGGLGDPVIKALIYGTLAGVFSLLWSILHLTGLSSTLFGLGGAVGIMVLVWSIVGAMIGLFIGGVFILIVSAICSGSTDYEANVRVTASLMVLSPINAFLGFFSSISIVLTVLIGLVVNLYGIWMLYHALNGSLKAKENSSKILAIILAVLLVVFKLIGIGTRSALKHYSGDMDRVASKYEKMAEDYGKAAQKMAEDANKTAMDALKDMQADNDEVYYELEMASGDTYSNPDDQMISGAFDNLNDDNDHIILSHGDDFVQAAVTDDGFLMEYKDKSGYYVSKETDLDKDKVISVFLNFLSNDPGWKDDIDWEKSDQ